MTLKISVIMPTFNSASVIDKALESIKQQDYPKDQVEIVIADAGSTDDTVKICKKYTDKIYKNPLKTGEAGKAVCLKHFTGDVVVFIDSDNILEGTDWFKKMVKPFEDKEIVATEPMKYTYRREDGFLTRYSALIGMNDPLCLYLGNYDRWNYITKKWTEVQRAEEDKGDYVKVEILTEVVPTFGANGFFVRSDTIKKLNVGDYYFDSDYAYDLTKMGHFAKVKCGIIHLYGKDVGTFIRKQQRRVNDWMFYRTKNLRRYPWKKASKTGQLKFLVYTILIFPLIFQSIKGYIRKPDRVWFFHILACWITLFVYGWGAIKGKLKPKVHDRTKWSQ